MHGAPSNIDDFPPADQCAPDDLDAIADLVVHDPRASYDLSGSREHIEALCRRYQRLAQHLVEATEECDDLKARCHANEEARTRLGDLTAECLADLRRARRDLEMARTEIRALASTLDAERNERQAEVLQAEQDRERADAGEAAAEVFEATARAALAILARRTFANPVPLAELVHAVDGRLGRALVRERQIGAAVSRELEVAMRRLEEHQQTTAANDRIRSAFASAVPAICDGVTVEELDVQLDAELAAHPDVGPLYHARDQRDHQEDTTP